ncbi:MAG: histidine phosphatase family protein [Phycisphaerales bacterium]|nr:MAG: histidine phosphatase family protein [Phycisphaerales bacterium]
MWVVLTFVPGRYTPRMTTTFHFVRHGSTTANERGIFMGMLDVPLSRTGLEQAQALREAIQHVHFDAVYCSPLMRAYHTALISLGWAEASASDGDSYRLTLWPRAEREHRAELIVDMRLAERSFGDLQGEPKEGYLQRFSKYAQRKVTMSFDDKADGGESFADLELRMANFIRDANERHAGETLLVFSHNGPIRIAAKLLLGLSEEETLARSNPHCELITFSK